ncbi:MAG: hypothetical protein OQL28_01890 [Sedimenticola sp.]|nr:hypothetical protein [Sedimenticola sp.]
MYDPLVHLHKTVLMQRLLDAVSRGYHWHTSGTVPLCKAQNLAKKFADRYDVHKSANQRAYDKRKRKASARLFMLNVPNSSDLYWWLLATGGNGAIHDNEKLRCALDSRSRIRTENDYELVRRTRLSTKGGGTVWSWRMTSECYYQWRERCISSCRRRESFVITQTIGSLYRTPGFSGTREQVGKLIALVRAEWRRRHGNLDALELPPALPYVERLANTAVLLSMLRK